MVGQNLTFSETDIGYTSGMLNFSTPTISDTTLFTANAMGFG